MKKSIILFLALLSWGLTFGQQDKKVESKIASVTVFLNKAQVTREVKTRIPAGTTNLVVPGLTAQLDPQSIQISGNGDFVLMGISHRHNYLNDLATPARLASLNDSLQLIQSRIVLENVQKQILDKEEQMLLSNQKIGGANQNLPVQELKNMADFFRNRLSEIAMARLKHEEKIKALNESLTRVQQQIRTQNELSGRNTIEIMVTLSAKAATDANLDLSYVVGNAGWVPFYNVRATNTKGPLTLFYKANVFQGTGEDWKNVALKLSTANPSLGGVKPDLSTWYLDFYQQRQVYQKYRKSAVPTDAPAAQSLSEMVVAGDNSTIADYVNVHQTSLNTEFEISLPYTVSSTNKPTAVDIGRHELKATYRYAAAPKLDPDAFLMAASTGWEDFDLLPGEADVFFEGTFVGKTFIDPQSVKDTLSFSLGRDKRIALKRTKIKDFDSQAIIGLNQKESHGFEINVRNNQSASITITVEDQIPVSKNNQIEVILTEAGGAKYEPATGKLVWEVTLKPNESRRLAYHFEVKYPKEKQIAGL